MRKIILFVLVGLLPGCAQYQLQQRQNAMAIAQLSMNGTCQAALQNHKLDLTREQIPDNPLKATVAQLTDKRYPAPEQRAAIGHREDYLLPCLQASEQYFSEFAPAALPIYQEMQQEGMIRLAALASGKMTFGQYNTERSRAVSQAWAQMQQAENARVAQARQLYLQQQAVQQQAIQNNINTMRALTPRTTTCSRFGQTVNCTTQ